VTFGVLLALAGLPFIRQFVTITQPILPVTLTRFMLPIPVGKKSGARAAALGRTRDSFRLACEHYLARVRLPFTGPGGILLYLVYVPRLLPLA